MLTISPDIVHPVTTSTSMVKPCCLNTNKNVVKPQEKPHSNTTSTTLVEKPKWQIYSTSENVKYMLYPEERTYEQQTWATRLSINSTTKTHNTALKLKDTNVKASHAQGNNLVQQMHLAITHIMLESSLSEVLDHCDKIVKRDKLLDRPTTDFISGYPVYLKRTKFLAKKGSMSNIKVSSLKD